MQHYAAFQLGLYCLKKYLFRGFHKCKGLIIKKKSQFYVKVCLSCYEEIYLNAKISGEQSSGGYHPSFSSIGVGLGTHPGSHHQPVFIRQVIVNGRSHYSLKLKSKLNKS